MEHACSSINLHLPKIGGGLYLLCIQTISSICLTLWAAITTLIILWAVNKIIPIRLSAEEEMLGCDKVEHFDDKDDTVEMEVMQNKSENVLTRSVCPCLLSHHNNLNQRRVFYVNESFDS